MPTLRVSELRSSSEAALMNYRVASSMGLETATTTTKQMENPP
jgi:hypothetical protein